MSLSTISPSLAVKYLREPGKAFVFARMTKHDSHCVEVKKSSLINLFSEFEDHIEIGYFTTMSLNSHYPDMVFDWS